MNRTPLEIYCKLRKSSDLREKMLTNLTAQHFEEINIENVSVRFYFKEQRVNIHCDIVHPKYCDWELGFKEFIELVEISREDSNKT